MAGKYDSTPDSEYNESGGRDATAMQQLLGLAWWKKLLLALAILLMATGLALPFVAPQIAEAQGGAVRQADGGKETNLPPGAMPQGFLPTDQRNGAGEDMTTAAETEPTNPWSPAIFRLGFSFVAGFAIAFAVRSFIKLALLFAGFFLLFLFGLEYAGLITVDWGAMSQHYDSFSAWLSAETSSVQDFITGRLPSAAAALAGLALGFTRK